MDMVLIRLEKSITKNNLIIKVIIGRFIKKLPIIIHCTNMIFTI